MNGKIKQNELDCRDTAPLIEAFMHNSKTIETMKRQKVYFEEDKGKILFHLTMSVSPK